MNSIRILIFTIFILLVSLFAVISKMVDNNTKQDKLQDIVKDDKQNIVRNSETTDEITAIEQSSAKNKENSEVKEDKTQNTIQERRDALKEAFK